MKGKRDFTKTEFESIQQLLSEKLRSSPSKQKGIRAKIRKMRFHIRDFGFSPDAFGPNHLNELRERGAIRIIGSSDPVNSPQNVPTKLEQNQKNVAVRSAPKSISPTTASNLRPYLRTGLDILFVALNPPVQSNTRGHYFSGDGSRFFKLLALSGLTTTEAPKPAADEIVFGGNEINHRKSEFGVVDLVEDLVETNSGAVQSKPEHVTLLLNRIKEYHPRFVCVIHSKVRTALNESPDISPKLIYGNCGSVLAGSDSVFFLNYFPNGNAIPDEPKLAIFRELRDCL